MKKSIKIISSLIVLFVAASVLGFTYFTKVFAVDNPRWAKFYEEEEGMDDGIYLGSSAAYDFWMPTKAYEKEGFCIYNLGTTVQPLCIEKYLIEEALSHQTNIKVIIIELRNLVRVEKDDMEEYIRLATDNMTLRTKRIEAIDTALAYYKSIGADINYNKWGYYYPALRAVHFSNYNITLEDLLMDPGVAIFKGYNRIKEDGVTELEPPEIYEGIEPLSKEQETMLLDLLEYCKGLDQKVIFVSAPFNPVDKERDKLGEMNTACRLCEEAGFTTLNFNLEPLRSRLNINWKKDFFDRGHANIYGAQRFTDCLTDILSEEMSLPDHRNNPAYESWNVETNRLNQFIEDIEKKQE